MFHASVSLSCTKKYKLQTRLCISSDRKRQPFPARWRALLLPLPLNQHLQERRLNSLASKPKFLKHTHTHTETHTERHTHTELSFTSHPTKLPFFFNSLDNSCQKQYLKTTLLLVFRTINYLPPAVITLFLLLAFPKHRGLLPKTRKAEAVALCLKRNRYRY